MGKTSKPQTPESHARNDSTPLDPGTDASIAKRPDKQVDGKKLSDKDAIQKEVLKAVPWLLLKCPEHLDPARDEPKQLQQALRLNEPPATGYYLKEELDEIWEQEDQETATQRTL